ncbi:MAG: dnaC2 [Clostridia bacterium]|nr:dnaC2 [Clostridia bacterium]
MIESKELKKTTNYNLNLKNNYNSNDNLDRKLPFSIESEQAILGNIILNPECIAQVALALKPDYFYIKKHKEIFEIMMDMYNLSIPIEGILLLERLREQGLFESDNDKEYLLSLAETASTIGDISYYIKIVSDKSFLREIIFICEGIRDTCFDNEELATVLDVAERKFYAISNGQHNIQLHKLVDVVSSEIDRLNLLEKDTTGMFEPLKAEISDFDNFLGGFNKSDLILLAARPGVGKTSFALNLAYNIAASSRYEAKKGVVFFSLEMSREQLARRILSSTLLIDSTDLRLGKLSENQWEEVFDLWHNTLPYVNMYLDDTPNITVVEMKSKLRRVKNLGMVVIDYLQLMNSSRRIDNRVQEISEITRSLKLLAKEFNVPLLLLSQLSRSIESRTKEDKTPRLSDLRDSGSIEQDADVVIFLSRPEYYDKETTQKNFCDVYIEKNRHGQTGKIGLQWDGAHTSFKSTARGNVPEH